MSFVQPKRCAQARTSSDADLAKISAWLEQQERNKVDGTFMCNWGITQQQHEEGKLLVYVDEATSAPVAYQWGGLLQSGILEVRNDMRGRGIGKALVAHRLAEAAEAGEDILYIQCKPSSSVPFWRKMGFELLASKDGASYAVRYMPRKLELPHDGTPVQVVIEWFSEAKKWAASTPAVRTQGVAGVLVDDEEIFLAERALCAHRVVRGDAVVRVCVDGQEWYCDKAKYAEEGALGMERCRNGFYLDALCRPERKRLAHH